MGAINYGSNNYFNIGMDLTPDYDEYDYMGDFNYLVEETQEILNKYNFDYFKIDIQYGYYQGFYIDIDFDYLYLDNHAERLTVLKEITQLKKLLFELSYIGLVNYSAGWCMGYCSEQETNQAIKHAIKQLKQDFIKYPTYYTQKRGA